MVVSMKILFYRYGSVCEPFILSAFQQYGAEVVCLKYEIYNKELLPSECVKYVSDALLASNYDFVFSVNFFPTVSDTCNIFHIPYVGWTVDSPVLELFSSSISNSCNYIFVFDRCQYADIAKLNPGHIFYLPLASDPLHMEKVIGAPHENTNFSSRISFVGSLYTEKCPFDALKNPPEFLRGFLDGIMATQEKIYGYYFIGELLTEDIIREFKAHMPNYYSPKDTPYLSDCELIAQYYIGNKISALERTHLFLRLAPEFDTDIYTGSDASMIPDLNNRSTIKTLTEMPLVFHNSQINLNITSKAIRSGIPQRVWDVLACGGFLITNYQSEIPEYFVPGEHLEVYESLDDLTDKCAYYLEHPDHAKEIAQNGLMLMKEKHTYLHRITSMIETLKGNHVL